MSRREPFHSTRFSGALVWAAFALTLAFLAATAPRLAAQFPILTTVATGNSPGAVAVNPLTNTIYVANAGDSTVSVYDGATATALPSSPISVGANPFFIAINSATNTIYVVGMNGVSVINGATNLVTATINTGAPSALAINPITNKIYVSDAESGNATVIDGVTNATSTVATGPSSQCLVVNPVTNQIYVLNEGNNTITQIDGASNGTSTINLSGNPGELTLAVNPVTNTVYTASANSIIAINGATGFQTPIILPNAGANIFGLAVNPVTNQIYAADRNNDVIYIMDGASGAVVSISDPSDPEYLTINSATNQVYVTNTDGSTTVISGVTASPFTGPISGGFTAVAVNPITNLLYLVDNANPLLYVATGAANTLSTVNTGSGPIAIVLNPITDQVVIPNQNDDTLTVLDGATGSTTTIQIPLSPGPTAINSLTNTVYSGDEDAAILVTNLNTGATTVLQGQAPQVAVAVNEVTNTTYFLNVDGSVDIINGQTLAITNIIAAPNFFGTEVPYAIAVNETTNQIYVTIESAGAPYVVDIDGVSTNTLAYSGLTSLETAQALAINPVTDQIYVANNQGNGTPGTVIVLDCVAQEYQGATFYLPSQTGVNPPSVAVGLGPSAIGVNPVTNQIYVVNSGDNTVTVVNGATEASTATLNVGATPTTVAVNAATNQIYIGNVGESASGLSVIDGATNLVTALAVSSPTANVVVNPVTGIAYALGGASNSITVVTPAAPASNSLATLIAPLPNNTTANEVTSFNLAAANLYGPIPQPIEGIYYQLDTVTGPWLPVVPGSFSSNGLAVFAGLPFGLHTLYAFALDGLETGSIDPVDCYSVFPGQVAAYTFLAAPSVFNFSSSSALAHSSDSSVTVTVQRNFTDAATVSYQTVDGSAVAGIAYLAAQGTLNFAAGQTTKTITVQLISQELSQETESFSIALSAPSAPATIGSPGSLSVVLLNDDSADIGISLLGPTAPSEPEPATATLSVTLTPAVGGWRLFGQPAWLTSADTILGLTAGNYEVEFQTVDGYVAPALQVLPITAGEQAQLAETYIASTDSQPEGSLTVTIEPSGTGGWQLAGDPSGVYHSSGDVVPNLIAGSYLVAFEPVNGLATPPNLEVFIQGGATTTLPATYLTADSTIGQQPSLVSPSLTQTSPPYEFLGQIQTDNGLGTGFVPLDRIVVTAAHVLFDDNSLTYAQGVRWYFQQDAGVYQAPAQIPVGTYVSSGYATQRAEDNTPGVASTAAEELDFAVLYFYEPTARGGQSGYLASNSSANPWLTSSVRNKLLVGYPVDVNFISAANAGQLYATPVIQSALQLVSGSLFETTAITSYAGNGGGPLCVQFDDGVYYPTAIYLGGVTGETVVRSIDSQVIELMTSAETSANGGANHVGGGVVLASDGLSGTTAIVLGSLNVTLGPPGAVTAGARWERGDNVPRRSGLAASGLAPGSYPITFSAVPGYKSPAPQTVSVSAGGQASISAAYVPTTPPTITSSPTAIGIMGLSFQYQIEASFDPSVYSIVSGALPAGLTLNKSSGLISGAPTSSAVGSTSLGLTATNAAGGSQTVTLDLTVAMPGQLTLTVSPAKAGSVPKKFTGQTIQAVGSSLTIAATPATGYLFDHWSTTSGAFLSSAASYKFTMPGTLDLQANFVPSPFVTAKGSYFALIQGGSYAESGSLQIAVSPLGSFTATFNLGGQTHKLVNSFTDQGQYSSQIYFPNGAGYDVTLTLTAGGILTGALTNMSDESQVTLTAAQPAAPPKALIGAYTAQLPLATANSSLPAGNGYGTIVISKSGSAAFSGFLGDGTPVHISGAGDSYGSWAFCFAKAQGKTAGAELVLGTVTPNLTAPTGYTATLDWFREPNANDPLYKNGFATQIALTAGDYKSPAVNYTTANVTLSGGDLSTPLIVPIAISSEGVVTAPGGPTGFALKLTSATGLFTGSFLDTGNAKRTFNGALLQSASSGEGFFQETNGLTGSVVLQKTP